MFRLLVSFCAASALAFGISACSKKAPQQLFEPTQARLFQSAPPETKALWDQAAAAATTNDYVAMIVTLRKVLNQPGLTPEQKQAVQENIGAAGDRLQEAAASGDAHAQAELDRLRKAVGR